MAGTINLMPGCDADCACEDCIIYESDFPGSASSTVDGFTEVTGDWEIDGAGKVTVTGPAILRCDTPHPDGVTGRQNLEVKLTALTGSLARIRGLVAYADVDNYLAAEVYLDAAGCDYLKLYQVAGGVETQLGDDQPIYVADWNEEYTLKVCWTPGVSSGGSVVSSGTLRASLSGGGLEFTFGNQAYATAEGAYVGLEVIGSVDVEFRGFKYKYVQDDTHSTCPNCNTPCPISADDFEDPTKSACLWDGGSFSGGKMTTSGRAKHLVFHPQLGHNFTASASVLDGPGVSATFSINDDDDGHALTATYGTDSDSRTLTIYRDGEQLGDPIIEEDVEFPDTPVSVSFHICYYGHELIASVAGLCLSEPASPIPNGKWVALDGNAVWDNFEVAKSKSREDTVCEKCDCPPLPYTCDGCCLSPQPPAEVIVDLGEGGWATNTFDTDFPMPPYPGSDCRCIECEDVKGEYLVEASASCAWNYLAVDCILDGPSYPTCGCFGAGPYEVPTFIELLLRKLPGESFCRWLLSVHKLRTDGELLSCQPAFAYYYSEQLDGDDKCNTFPVRMTKRADALPAETTNAVCKGTLPDEVWLRSAA